MHTNFGGVLRKAEISETFVTREVGRLLPLADNPGGSRYCRGKVYQYFSLKYTFIIAVILFEIGSLVSGVSTAPD